MTDLSDPELTAEEARTLADQLGLDLYRAQDALAFVEECCVIADREGRTVTTADVRKWLKGAQCGRQLTAEEPDTVRDLTAALRERRPDPAAGPEPWQRLTARSVTPEMEQAATERARQAAEASEKSAAWFAEQQAGAERPVRDQLAAGIKALGKSETELAGLRAELAAVTALYRQWVKAGAPPLGVPLARWWDKRLVELHNVLEQSAGTTVNNPAASSDTPARHIRITVTHPDEYTANRFTLSLVDSITADYGDSIRMRVETDAAEWETPAVEASCSPAAPETEPNNSAATPSRRAGLRDEIAAAIWERQNPGCRYADCEYRWRADAEADADAVLALLYREWPWLRAESEDTPAWTPPPPGDRREQLPDHLLALIRPYLRGYQSTACQTAGYLEQAIAEHPDHRVELGLWRERMRARCRANQKYTGELCPHHTAAEESP
ncbi:hypothetical protein [Streptomyces sp. B21-083]|uniref:hypothetical protein n=1 Tax=Streptomyces sp. B21-083 TaxID=3039410 RepID=UPI002FEFA386